MLKETSQPGTKDKIPTSELAKYSIEKERNRLLLEEADAIMEKPQDIKKVFDVIEGGQEMNEKNRPYLYFPDKDSKLSLNFAEQHAFAASIENMKRVAEIGKTFDVLHDLYPLTKKIPLSLEKGENDDFQTTGMHDLQIKKFVLDKFDFNLDKISLSTDLENIFGMNEKELIDIYIKLSKLKNEEGANAILNFKLKEAEMIIDYYKEFSVNNKVKNNFLHNKNSDIDHKSDIFFAMSDYSDQKIDDEIVNWSDQGRYLSARDNFKEIKEKELNHFIKTILLNPKIVINPGREGLNDLQLLKYEVSSTGLKSNSVNMIRSNELLNNYQKIMIEASKDLLKHKLISYEELTAIIKKGPRAEEIIDELPKPVIQLPPVNKDEDETETTVDDTNVDQSKLKDMKKPWYKFW